MERAEEWFGQNVNSRNYTERIFRSSDKIVLTNLKVTEEIPPPPKKTLLSLDENPLYLETYFTTGLAYVLWSSLPLFLSRPSRNDPTSTIPHKKKKEIIRRHCSLRCSVGYGRIETETTQSVTHAGRVDIYDEATSLDSFVIWSQS